MFMAVFIMKGSAFAQSSFYSLSIDSLGTNATISFSSFSGKKVLVTNMASADSSFRQYEELKQLYNIYKDSLVIVVLPVNNFGTETGNSQQVDSIYSQTADSTFFVSAKLDSQSVVTNTLYLWLISESLNGIRGTIIKRPGYKFLIDESGRLRGVFNDMVTPMSNVLRQAIELKIN